LNWTNGYFEAIKVAAEDWKVDIIIMSFGFQQSIPEIETAINNASNLGVNFFAAASNGSIYEDPPIAFPARLNGKVTAIRSFDGDHKLADKSPPDDHKYCLGALGEGIKSVRNPSVRVSGTSFATPLAAGIAALVLEYARSQKVMNMFTAEEHSFLRTHRGMYQILEGLMKSNNIAQHACIIPWKLFDDDKSLAPEQQVVLFDSAVEDIKKQLKKL
jgi:subtilisin family serine protease